MKTILIQEPHPARLDESGVRKTCEEWFGRGSGPGGQHRNKVATEANIKHLDSGIVAFAGERRVQSQNRHEALRRIRLKLAVRLRVKTDPDRHRPSELWTERRQGKQMSVNPRHFDYPALLSEALDVIYARRFDVAGSAGVLKISMSQLAKLLRHHRPALVWVNEEREARGMHKLK